MNNDEDFTNKDFKEYCRANMRECNGFWWRDKPVGERSIARHILKEAGIQIEDLRSLSDDPPDCEANLDGQFSGIEVVGLAHQRTLDRSINAVKHRSELFDLQNPEVYFIWQSDDLIKALHKILDDKNQKILKKNNSANPKRSHERYVLVIHADEVFLDSDTVGRFLEDASFKTSLITRGFLGLSYEPGKGYRAPDEQRRAKTKLADLSEALIGNGAA